MNEVKKARQQLDARNGIQPAKPKKPPKKRTKDQAPKTENTSKRRTQAPSRSPQPAQRTQKRPAPGPSRPVSQKQRAPALDERQRAQQAVAAKRKRKRKKNHILYYLILFLFIVVAGIILSLTVFFNIEQIDVEGTSRYSSEEIVEKSGLKAGDNLFRISTGDAVDQIINSFEYIDKVEINRAFPNKLTIKITEAEPGMSFLYNGTYSLVSDEGRILEAGLAEPPEGTFIVSGISLEGYKAGDFISSDTSPEIEALHTINEICTEMEFGTLTRIDVNSIVDIRLYLNDQIRVDIGSITDLQYKLTFADSIISDRLASGDKGVIDVKQAGTAFYRPSENLSNSSSSGPEPSQSSEPEPD